MLASIYTGVFDFNRTSLVTPSCPSGNCAWNTTVPDITTYSSLGVCSKCQDSSVHLQKSCSTTTASSYQITDLTGAPYNLTAPYCNYTLPNGLSLSGVPDGSYKYIAASGELQNMTQFQNLSNPFSILSTIRSTTWAYVYANGTVVDDQPDIPLTTDDAGNSINVPDGERFTYYLKEAASTECALYYCIQSLSSAVINGSYSETITDTYYNDTVGDTSLIDTGRYDFAPNFTLTVPTAWKLAPNTPRTFDVYGNAWYATYDQFFSFWNGNASGVQSAADVGSPSYSSDIIKTILEQGSEKIVQTVAQAMTTNMRQSTGESSRGISYQMVPYVVVSWAWITLPASLVVIAFILLVSTIFSTIKNGTRLWKTSSLAAFYHPLTDRGRGKIGEASNKVHLDKISEDVSVRWTKTEKGWRFIPTQDGENSRKAR